MKIMLQFEDISCYLQYNARSEAFLHNKLAPNPECKSAKCRELQDKKKGSDGFLTKRAEAIEAKREANKVVYEPDANNEWGIEIVEEDQGIEAGEQLNETEVKNADVSDLMAKLKGL